MDAVVGRAGGELRQGPVLKELAVPRRQKRKVQVLHPQRNEFVECPKAYGLPTARSSDVAHWKF